MFFKFFSEEIWVVNDFFEIFFGIIIKLSQTDKYHAKKAMESDSFSWFWTLLREKGEEQSYFLFLSGFEKSH